MSGAEWREPARAEAWASARREVPRIGEAEAMLIECLIPGSVERLLDLGTGDGHLIALLRERWPAASAVGLDLSPTMIATARARFAAMPAIWLEVHDLMRPLPDGLGRFDLVVSALAIHHLPDVRKRELFAEVFAHLTEGGLFYDLDAVRSASPALHRLNQAAFRYVGYGDPSDQQAALADQLVWLHEAGFEDVDCFWKWMELSLVGGRRPTAELATPRS